MSGPRAAATPRWKSAWIVGASSGIGRELALRLTRQGTHVAATARSAAALDALAAETELMTPYPADVTDEDRVAETVAEIERRHGPIDLAVLSSGYWQPMGAHDYAVPAVRTSMEVNYLGAAHCLAALMPRMIERGAGQIAIVSSVAGYSGLPGAAAYGPSKAALINLAESLAPELHAAGVQLQLVNPGFVETPMTAKNDFPMPMIIPAEKAAECLLDGLAGGGFEITFPKRFTGLMKLLRILPYRLFFRVSRRMMRSPRS